MNRDRRRAGLHITTLSIHTAIAAVGGVSALSATGPIRWLGWALLAAAALSGSALLAICFTMNPPRPGSHA